MPQAARVVAAPAPDGVAADTASSHGSALRSETGDALPFAFRADSKEVSAPVSQSPSQQQQQEQSSSSSKQIVGKYELGRALAVGDFDCRTCLCTHIVTGATYVVRIYAKAVLAEAEWMWERVRGSIHVQRTLPKHENIVEMIECFETRTSLYILMQLFPSENLVTLLNENKEAGNATGSGGEEGYQPQQHRRQHGSASTSTGPRTARRRKGMSVSMARKIFEKVVHGILHMHAHSVVHLGIAPDHILVNTDKGRVKISNLISCCFCPRGRRMTELKGTRHTVAPEVLRKEPYDPYLADAWSLGVLLYFMLNDGYYPHDGANTVKHILYGHIRPCRASVPAAAKDLIARLLQQQPSERLTAEAILLHPFMTDAKYASDSASPNRHRLHRHHRSPRSSPQPLEQQQQHRGSAEDRLAGLESYRMVATAPGGSESEGATRGDDNAEGRSADESSGSDTGGSYSFQSDQDCDSASESSSDTCSTSSADDDRDGREEMEKSGNDRGHRRSHNNGDAAEERQRADTGHRSQRQQHRCSPALADESDADFARQHYRRYTTNRITSCATSVLVSERSPSCGGSVCIEVPSVAPPTAVRRRDDDEAGASPHREQKSPRGSVTLLSPITKNNKNRSAAVADPSRNGGRRRGSTVFLETTTAHERVLGHRKSSGGSSSDSGGGMDDERRRLSTSSGVLCRRRSSVANAPFFGDNALRQQQQPGSRRDSFISFQRVSTDFTGSGRGIHAYGSPLSLDLGASAKKNIDNNNSRGEGKGESGKSDDDDSDEETQQQTLRQKQQQEEEQPQPVLVKSSWDQATGTYRLQLPMNLSLEEQAALVIQFFYREYRQRRQFKEETKLLLARAAAAAAAVSNNNNSGAAKSFSSGSNDGRRRTQAVPSLAALRGTGNNSSDGANAQNGGYGASTIRGLVRAAPGPNTGGIASNNSIRNTNASNAGGENGPRPALPPLLSFGKSNGSGGGNGGGCVRFALQGQEQPQPAPPPAKSSWRLGVLATGKSTNSNNSSTGAATNNGVGALPRCGSFGLIPRCTSFVGGIAPLGAAGGAVLGGGHGSTASSNTSGNRNATITAPSMATTAQPGSSVFAQQQQQQQQLVTHAHHPQSSFNAECPVCHQTPFPKRHIHARPYADTRYEFKAGAFATADPVEKQGM